MTVGYVQLLMCGRFRLRTVGGMQWVSRIAAGGPRTAAALDAALAAVLTVLVAEGTWSATSDRGQDLSWAAYALVAVAGAALVVRRRWPLAVLGACFVATLVFLAAGFPYGPVLQLATVAAYTVGAWCSRRAWITSTVVTVSGYLLMTAWIGGPPWLGAIPLAVIWLVAPGAVGVAAARYRALRIRMAQAEQHRYLAEERLRIAREVHDVLGHSLAVISLQAGVALHVLNRRPDRAEQALTVVRQTSALALRDLAGVLAPLDAHPGLDRIQDLVESVSTSDLTAELVVEGAPASIPAAVELAVYRIVQESLTNTLRHSGARAVRVQLDFGDVVTVTVTDDGRGSAQPQRMGRGLVGMRERASAVGGTLTAAAGDGGGFEVRAVLPVSTP